MKMRDILLIIGFISCLFSTSFASTADGWDAGVVVSKNDPNLVMVAQGAPESDLVYCDKCGGWVHRSDAPMRRNTNPPRSSTPVNTGAPTNDKGDQ